MKKSILTALSLSILAFTSLAFPPLDPLSWTEFSFADLVSNDGDKRKGSKKTGPADSISADAISITTLGTPITQSFNTLPTTGTGIAWADDTTLPGWYSQFELTPTSPTTYRASNGSITTAGLVSLGHSGMGSLSDRALGSVPVDVGTDTSIGTVFNALKLVNSSGSAIASINVSYVGEQYRAAGCTGAGCTPASQKVDFQYQVASVGAITDANAPSTGWVDFNDLDFPSPTVGTSVGAGLDGNAPANRTSKSANVPVAVNHGQEIWIRWVDVNAPNLDHILAIDDVSVTPLAPVVNNCDFCNLQFPSSFTVTGGESNPFIYGRISEAGITEAAGASASVTAQIGYGPAGSDPRSSLAWVYTQASFNTQVGNADEYVGTITAPATASTIQYRYTFRFSLDGGANWTYADLNGAGANPGLSFDPAQLGVMTVNPGSAPPMINSAAPATATEDTLYTYNATATDPDGLGLTWSLAAPTHTCGGSINAATGLITFTPAGPVPPASCVVAVRATDGFAPTQSATQTTSVTIAAVNDPPSISGSAPTSATEYAVYSYSPAVIDPDGSTPLWTLNSPTHTCGGEINSSTGAFSFTPAGPSPPANCVVSIRVSDGFLSATQSTTVAITDFASSVQFSASNFSKREGTTLEALIVREGSTTDADTINYSFGSGNATGGSCGTAGVDYANPTGTINFAAGETQKSISIQLCSDKIKEIPHETFDITITSAGNAGIAPQSSTTISILDSLNKAMWVFGGSINPNPVSAPSGRSSLLSRSYHAGISELYISVYQGTPDTVSGRLMYADSDIAALNASAHGAGQEVWAAYGNTDWPALTAGCTGSSFPELRMSEVVAFNASRSPNERFDGVMLDVEPAPSTEAEFQALIAHYECMRSRLPSAIKLGVAISAFWDDDIVNYSSSGPTGEALKPASSHIIDLDLDRVVVMGYRDTAGTDSCPTSDGIICLDMDEVDYATSIGKPGLVFAGLETLNPAFAGLLDKETFYDEGQNSMEAEATAVGEFFNGSGGFGGFAIHNYGSAFLSGETWWPVGPSAAEVYVSGRVATARGNGIRGAIVTVSGGDLVSPRVAFTSTFGYFKLSGLSAGQTYILTINAKRHSFADPARAIDLSNSITNMDFIALP